jgi:glycosyltransferase involved in cell wall biosynthesis
MPLVSVIIPAYQRAYTLVPVLEKVFAQTFTDYEVIIADDGSKDNTQEVLAPYRDRIIYEYAENRGASSARNRGARLARGKYLAFLDSDDFWEPRKLELQVALLECQPEVGWVYCDRRIVGSPDGDSERNFALHPPHRGWILKHFFLQHSPAHTSTLVVRKKLYEAAGGFDETLRVFEDHDLYFRLAERSQADYVDELLVHCCRDNRGPYAKPTAEMLESRLEFKRRALRNNPTLQQEFNKLEFRRGYVTTVNEVAVAYAEQGDYQKANALFKECTQIDPAWFKPWIYRSALKFPSLFVSTRQWLAKVKSMFVSTK